MNLVSAKCPNCGADIEVDDTKTHYVCKYCKKNIIKDDKLLKKISINGIQTNSDLIVSANELLEMDEYLKAKKLFLEFAEKCPNDYQGWLGLLICRTRNFTIRDNNILFKKDVENYYNHFQKTAPNEMKIQYDKIMEEYFNEIKPVELSKDSSTEFSILRVIGLTIGIMLIIIGLASVAGNS